MLHGVRVQVSPSAPELGYSQVGKAAGFDPAIRRFKSCYPSHFPKNVRVLSARQCCYQFSLRLGYSQVGKAAGFDPAIRRFKSCYPSHSLQYFHSNNQQFFLSYTPFQCDIFLIRITALMHFFTVRAIIPEAPNFSCRFYA